MQLTIIKNNKLNVFDLPEKIDNNYWITDYENGKKINLINIEAEDDHWKLISNEDAYVIDNKGVMIPYVILKEDAFYIVKNNYKNETNYLYCSSVIDNTYKELGLLEGVKITMGSSKKSSICYNLKGIPENSYNISKENNHYYLTIEDPKSSVYVNQRRVISRKKLEYGDIIFNFGLKVILMRHNGTDYLLVNNPSGRLDFNASMVNIITSKNDFVDDKTELPIDVAKKNDSYFYRAPHFYKNIVPFEINVDSPPSSKKNDETPAILTIGPMLTMSMTSIVMLTTALNQIGENGKTFADVRTSVIMCGAMLGSTLLWPMVTKKYQKFSNKKYEIKRQKNYKSYLDGLEKKISAAMENQRDVLINNNFTITKCEKVIEDHNTNLWQKRITDDDFLTLPVGIGSIPMKIDIKYPEEHFSMDSDNLLDLAYELGRKKRILENIPIIYSFYDNITTGIVGEPRITKDFMDRIMLQLMANYSYDEVKVVTLTSLDNESAWEYMKVLPHSWSNDKTFRFFGSTNDDYREIMYVIENIYNQRKNSQNQKTNKQIPHYVIITDAIKSIDNYDFLKEIMSSGTNYGFSIVILVDKLQALPNECKNFIEINNDECKIFSSLLNNEIQTFKIDESQIEDLYQSALELANIPIDIKSDIELSLPDTYHFLEMYQVGKVEQINSLERWKKSNPILSLQAPVGIGKNGEIVYLDLHEKYHGPHGLIAGTTGSGKSEFIITYILSLALNYHPYEVQFILIDYKGGSLTGAFSNDKYEIPHIAGTITNLDGNELNRSLASIESEIKRRQREFNDAKNITGESTMDIYKYQKLYRDGKLKEKEPISHLFIISDEFAELKTQQPEFMSKLISAARVGRALGIHLILATQKPGGIVDAQIWSNTRFRICLKVQDTSDSQEVLKKPDAAYLKKTGRFYLQVGYDEVFTLGQAAWAGAQYYPSNTFKREVDTSINVINNTGFVTTSKDIDNNEVKVADGEELSNLVKYLSNLGKSLNLKVRKLWLDKIPPKIFIDSLKSKYRFVRKEFYLNPIIGEFDDPENQTQNALTVPLSKHGNTIIYGITGSGKEMFIKSLLYSMMSSYLPEEVNFYILDFGGETLKIFNKSPYVGDVCFVNETDKIMNLFKLLNTEIEIRKKIFSNYGGTYQSYIESNNKDLPNIVVIINNYEAFAESYENLTEELIQITRDCNRYGIYFVITTNSDSGMRMKIKQNFSLNYALAQNNDMDYSNILGNCRGKIPAKLKGRGLFKRDAIYEFQTAMITEDNENAALTNYFKVCAERFSYRAKPIPVLPDIVDFDVVKDSLNEKYNLPIGVNKESLNIEKYNFAKSSIDIISSQEVENTYKFVNALIDEIQYTNHYNTILVNNTELTFNKENIETYTNNYDELINKIFDYIQPIFDEYQKDNYNEEIITDKNKYMLIIYGVNDFVNKMSPEVKNKLNDIVKMNNQINLVNMILVDTPDILKTFAYDEWFKSGTDTTRGIWVGSGIADQMLLKVSKTERSDRDEIPNDYGYLIVNSRISRIKLLQDFKSNNL